MKNISKNIISVLYEKYIYNTNNINNLILSKDNNFISFDNGSEEIIIKNNIYVCNNDIINFYLEKKYDSIYFMCDINIINLENIIKNGYCFDDREIIFEIFYKYQKKIFYDLSKKISFDKLILKNIDNNIKIDNNVVLYDYQKNIVKWMLQIENNINQKIYYLPNDIVKLKSVYLDLTNGKTYLDYKYSFFNITGGILIDEYCYGKTTISTVLCGMNNIHTIDILDNNKIVPIQVYDEDLENSENNFDNMKEYYIYKKSRLVSNSILIICPFHLVKLWKIEIDNLLDNIKIIQITNKKDFDSYTYEDLMISDFVIVSINFFNNKYFKKCWKNYKINEESSFNSCIEIMGLELMRNKNLLKLNNPIISLFYWKRIIIDDFTQIMEQSYYKSILFSLKSIYKWYLSNKIPENNDYLFNFLKIIIKNMTYKDNISLNFYKKYNNQNYLQLNTSNFLKNLVIINKKNDVLKEIDLPQITEQVKFLEFSKLEKILYKSYLKMYKNINFENDDENIDVLYTGIYDQIINDIHSSLINCKSLEQVQKEILELGKKKIDKYKKIKLKLEKKKIELLENYNKIDKNDIIKNLDTNISEIDKNIDNSLKHIDYFNNITDIKIKSSTSSPDFDYAFDLEMNDNNEENNFNNKNNNNILNDLENCCICLNKLEDNNIGISICGHLFCFFCIIKNVNYNKKCPVCRSELDKKDIFKINNNKKLEKINSKIINCDMDISYKKVKKQRKMSMLNDEVMISKSLGSSPNKNFMSSNLLLNSNINFDSFSEENYDYDNNYCCTDISLYIELYGVKVAYLLKYIFNILYFNINEKIIIYSKLSERLLDNICEILKKHGFPTITCYGSKIQKTKIIDRFNNNKYNVIIIPIKNMSLCVNIVGITKVIFLEPLFGDSEYIRNIEKQGLGLTYYQNKIKNISIIRFIVKDSIEEDIYKKVYQKN